MNSLLCLTVGSALGRMVESRRSSRTSLFASVAWCICIVKSDPDFIGLKAQG